MIIPNLQWLARGSSSITWNWIYCHCIATIATLKDRSEAIHKRILTEDKLALKRAIKTATGMETAPGVSKALSSKEFTRLQLAAGCHLCHRYSHVLIVIIGWQTV
jgi:hypothetical protein